MAGIIKMKEASLSSGKVRYFLGGTGPGLILCHSAFGDAELCWNQVWTDLAASFSVLAPDLPGFGGSDALRRPSTEAMAGVLKELMEAVGMKEALVAGNSFSANLVLTFANLFPEKVTRVAMINGTVPFVL